VKNPLNLLILSYRSLALGRDLVHVGVEFHALDRGMFVLDVERGMFGADDGILGACI
jgi:hypothetical protein